MPMLPQIFSISGLAVELGVDRRTVAAKLRNVRPDGDLPGGLPGWRLLTAMNALGLGNGRTDPAPLTPRGFRALEQVENPLDQGFLIAALTLAYGIGPLSASMAVGAGASLRVAFALERMMVVAFSMKVEELSRALEVEPFTRNPQTTIFDPAAFDEANWENLAAIAGEQVNREEWESWARQRCAP
jgi:hypothetical protein